MIFISVYYVWVLCLRITFPKQYDSLQMHGELHKSVENSPLLRLKLTQVRVCLLFSFTLSVVFCVSIKKCVMPLIGDERKPLDESLAISSLV